MFLSQAILRTRLFIIQILSVALSQGYLMVPSLPWYQQFHQRPMYRFTRVFPPVRSPVYFLPHRDVVPKPSASPSYSPLDSQNYYQSLHAVTRKPQTKESQVRSHERSEFLSLSLAPHTEEVADQEDLDAETSPDLIEGDIAISEDLDPRLRLAVDFARYPTKKWPNNTVRYKISTNYSSSEVLMIESAMRTISFVSCIKFLEWDGTAADYVHFQPDNKRLGCWSYIGHQGGRQQLSLEQPDLQHCNCFCSTGRALHEIMHALGFYHEHSRADRDKYIKIVNKNVRKGKQRNFHTKGDDKTTRNFDYDYDSIMHYGPYYFSKSKRRGKATIIPLKSGITIGQRDMLSKMDCMKLNSLYDCISPDSARRTQLLCGMIGV